MNGWISVKDRLPDHGPGIEKPYRQFRSGVVLVIHSDRPDYPITAHALFSDDPEARGVAIHTDGISPFKYVCWYSAGRDLQNPFDLKKEDYTRYLPNRFGAHITHWMPLPEPPKE